MTTTPHGVAKYDDKTKEFLLSGLSDNTRKAYTAGIKHFSTWCEANGRTAFPADEQTLLGYIQSQVGQAKPSAVKLRLSAIRKVHKMQGQPMPDTDAIDTAVKAFARVTADKHQDKRLKMAKPTLENDLRDALSKVGSRPLDVRDKAISLLMYFGAFRKSEVVALTVEDLTFDADGVTVLIRKSKTDQQGEGNYKYLPFKGTLLCPVTALKTWLSIRNEESTALFQPLNRAGIAQAKGIHPQNIHNAVKRIFGADFSTHSFRAGFVTQARINGATNAQIMAQTHHKTGAMIDRYTRIQDTKKHNAVNLI